MIDFSSNSASGSEAPQVQPAAGEHRIVGPLPSNVKPLGDLLEGIREDLFSNKPPVEYAVAAAPWGSIAFRPYEILAVAGPPANGKTALVMQWVFDAVRLNDNVRCLVVNVEMTPAKLIERQIARFSGVPMTDIQKRRNLDASKRPICEALNTLATIQDRLFFMSEPFNMAKIVEAVDATNPDVLVIDYIQRIGSGYAATDVRMQVNAVMSELRELANAGLAVVLVSAVGRTSSKRGGGYHGDAIGLGSFRESSEIEYGIDDGLLLIDENPDAHGGDGNQREFTLRHVKSRNREPKSLRLKFIGAMQSFEVIEDETDENERAYAAAVAVGPRPPVAALKNPESQHSGAMPRVTYPSIDPLCRDVIGDGRDD